MQTKIQAALTLLTNNVCEYNTHPDNTRKRDIESLWALVSGGDDSMAMLEITRRHPLFAGVIHIHTMDSPVTNEVTAYVAEYCHQQGYQLIIAKPTTAYLQLIVRYGFPGPAQHTMMYRYLKERPLRQAKKKARKMAGEPGFVTGVRSDESIIRMGHVKPLTKNGSGVWLAPIHDWTAAETRELLNQEGIERNPVKEAIGISGECLCGAYASQGEREGLVAHNPGMRAWLDGLEAIVSTSQTHMGGQFTDQGIDNQYTRWGWGANKHVAPGQMKLWGEATDNMLCHSCNHKAQPSEQDLAEWLG